MFWMEMENEIEKHEMWSTTMRTRSYHPLDRAMCVCVCVWGYGYTMNRVALNGYMLDCC